MNDIIGFLRDEGYSDFDIEDATGLPVRPIEAAEFKTGSVPQGSAAGHRPALPVRSSVHAELHGADETQLEALRKILCVARDQRLPPGRTGVVVGGVLRHLPGAAAAKVVRVDTEESYKQLRRAQGQGAGAAGDDPIDALSTAADDELMGRAWGADIVGDMVGDMVGDDSFYTMPRTAAHLVGDDSFYTLPHTSHLIGAASDCVACGTAESPGALCRQCRARAAVLLGFGERGSASQMYDDVFDAGTAPGAEMLGFGERGAASEEALMSLVGDVMALEPASQRGYPQDAIPLSFDTEDKRKHTAAWRQGDNLYASIRVTGWDGAPRVLTGTMSYAKSMQQVIGYVEQAGVDPAVALPMLDPLARQLGVSQIIPPLAACSPTLLHLARKQQGATVVGGRALTEATPFKVAILPTRSVK